MNREDRVFTECWGDTLMMKYVLRKNLPHFGGINEVGNHLQWLYESGKKSKVIGVIDDDKKKHSFFYQFEKIDEKTGLELKQLEGTSLYVIVIKPALEKWLWQIAEREGIDMNNYSFSSSKKIGQACKSLKANENPQLNNLLNDLDQKGADGFQTLKKWIQDIIGQNA